jgi:hypothetical protein
MTKWEKILKEVKDYQIEAQDTEGVDLWFRGQSDSNWGLESTLHRYVRNFIKELGFEFDESWAIKALWEQYKTLYWKYKSKAWHLLSESEKKEWGVIFSMRHHGVPTTLLDWTESFVYALYFANLGRNPKKDATIFILHPPRLNLKSVNQKHLIFLEDGLHEEAVINLNHYHPRLKRPGDKLPTIAVTPVLTNPKMIAQRSNFIICGNSFSSLEAEYSDSIKKIILPADTFNESEDFLNLHGVSHFTLFPDFHGLKEELMRELEQQVLMVKKKKKLDDLYLAISNETQ